MASECPAANSKVAISTFVMPLHINLWIYTLCFCNVPGNMEFTILIEKKNKKRTTSLTKKKCYYNCEYVQVFTFFEDSKHYFWSGLLVLFFELLKQLSPCEKYLSWVTVHCSKSANCHLWISRRTFRCPSTDYLIVKIIILLYLIIYIVWWVTLDLLPC